MDVFSKWNLIKEINEQRFVCQTFDVSGICVPYKFSCVLRLLMQLNVFIHALKLLEILILIMINVEFPKLKFWLA